MDWKKNPGNPTVSFTSNWFPGLSHYNGKKQSKIQNFLHRYVWFWLWLRFVSFPVAALTPAQLWAAFLQSLSMWQWLKLRVVSLDSLLIEATASLFSSQWLFGCIISPLTTSLLTSLWLCSFLLNFLLAAPSSLHFIFAVLFMYELYFYPL